MKQVLTGYFAYYAVQTNGRTLLAFRYRVIDFWRRSLLRRSQKDRTNWERITKLVKDFLPPVKILHPSPLDPFVVKHPPWEPMPKSGPLGSVRGALSNERPYRDLRCAERKFISFLAASGLLALPPPIRLSGTVAAFFLALVSFWKGFNF